MSKVFIVFSFLLMSLNLFAENSPQDTGAAKPPQRPATTAINAERQEMTELMSRFSVQILNKIADPFVVGDVITGSSGTGFIYSIDKENDEVIIFTNKHVIEIPERVAFDQNPDGSHSFIMRPDFFFQELKVAKKYGEYQVAQKATAEILFVSPIYDFSVLKVKLSALGEDAADYFREAPIATAEDYQKFVKQGRLVMAYGYPNGATEVGTDGSISALDQEISDIESGIMTTAAINPGNSGGALADMESGFVIGVNTWKHVDADNMGFAIPIVNVMDEFRHYLEDKDYGKKETDFLVFQIMPANYLARVGVMDMINEYYPDYMQKYEKVLQVSDVTSDSELRAGDYLLSIDGQPVGGSFETYKRLYNSNRTESLRMEVLRSGKQVFLDIPVRIENAMNELDTDYLAFSGRVFRDLTEKEKELLGLEGGVIVATTYRDPYTDSNPMETGSALKSIQGPNGDIEIENLKHLKEFLAEVPVGSFLQMQIFFAQRDVINGVFAGAGVRAISRPSSVVTERYSGMITSDELPLRKFREHYDFTGTNPAASSFSFIFQNALTADVPVLSVDGSNGEAAADSSDLEDCSLSLTGLVNPLAKL